MAGNQEIVVTGDVCIDWLQVTLTGADTRHSSRSPASSCFYPGMRHLPLAGSALLLAELVSQATNKLVRSPHLKDLAGTSPDKVVHSLLELQLFPREREEVVDGATVYRIRRFGGFDGPPSSVQHLLQVEEDNPNVDFLVLEDDGSGFRDAPEFWPQVLKVAKKEPLIVLLMRRPFNEGKLWDHLISQHASRLVVVVSADDLRAEGIQLSRRLSWERTAKDFVWQMRINPAMTRLSRCAHLVVVFGHDGAIHHQSISPAQSRLYYDPLGVENGFREMCPGEMVGSTLAFVAAMVARLADQGISGIGRGIREGILAARRLFQAGFGTDPAKLLYPTAQVFPLPDGADHAVSDVVIPPADSYDSPDPMFWCILHDLRLGSLEEIAHQVLVKGEATALQGVPVGCFGTLRTVDRREIESYRSIKNLIQEYCDHPAPKRPLSIAVFGRPGSGKSRGIMELARSVMPGRTCRLTFNLSQARSSDILTRAFHQTQNVALANKIPLVFFDEFDSPFEGELGWLKYLLMPMENGVFCDGDTEHPIGKAVFVFAGGTSETLAQFAQRNCPDAKLSDFVSRLRGYVNILGPDRIDDDDRHWIIRRAIQLRSLLLSKAPQIFDGGLMRIDAGVLRAMLQIPKYEHGVRSMEAILDMSLLSKRNSFEKAALPSTDQLRLHVKDAELFTRLVVQDYLFEAACEFLARAIHERHCLYAKDDKPFDDPTMLPWEQIPEELRASDRRRAKRIPEHLRSIGYHYTIATYSEKELQPLTDDEVTRLAELFHNEWLVEKKQAGYTVGQKKNPTAKTNPNMVEWPMLHETIKARNRSMARDVPQLMSQFGFFLYRPN